MRTVREIEARFDQVEGAIRQIEENEHANLRTIDQKLNKALEKVRGEAWDGQGNYRGVFDCEQDAKAFGLFMMAQTHSDPGTRAWAAKTIETQHRGLMQRDMSTGESAAGGATIPVEFSARLKRMIESRGVFARNAFRMPMSSNELTFMKVNGELTVYLATEGIAPTDSQPDFVRVNLTAKEWAVLVFYPRNLGDDSVAEIGELLATMIVDAITLKMDSIAFNGDGSSQYFGIRGIIQKLKDVSADITAPTDGSGLVLGSGNAWGELQLTDYENVQGAYPDYQGSEPKWYMHRKHFFTVCRRLALQAGGVTAAEIIASMKERMFLGDPVEFVSVMPKVQANSQVCALYGDMARCATLGMRREIGVEESREYKFAERQVTVLGLVRPAISIEDVGDDENAGPMIGLITASA